MGGSLGNITGEVSGKNITYKVRETPSSSNFIFNGTVSDDYLTLTGSVYVENGFDEVGSWTLSYAGFNFGDTDGDGLVQITDVVTIIDSVLNDKGITKGSDCNDDGAMDITDVVCAINVVLSN